VCLEEEKEWRAKLEREFFNYADIQKAITCLPTFPLPKIDTQGK
jgi:hypothetical protein